LKHTETDANKRGKKGYLFTIGDELPPNEPLPGYKMKGFFGYVEEPMMMQPKDLLAATQEKYKVFHILAEEGSMVRGRPTKLLAVREAWKDLLGPNVVFMRNHKFLDEIVIAVLKIADGADVTQTINESRHPEEIRYALGL
jgi:hypothetical protein